MKFLIKRFSTLAYRAGFWFFLGFILIKIKLVAEPGSGQYIAAAVDEILSSSKTWNIIGVLGIMFASISMISLEISSIFRSTSNKIKVFEKLYSIFLVPTKDLVFTTFDIGCLVLSLYLFSYMSLFPSDLKSLGTSFIFGFALTKFSYIIFMVGVIGIFVEEFPNLDKNHKLLSKPLLPIRLLLYIFIIMLPAYLTWTHN